MIVDKRQQDGRTVLRVEGVIRLGESAEFFANTLERVLNDETAGDVVIDLEKINYIDSTGIGELVGYLARFRSRERRLMLVRPSERIRKLLEVARLTELFPIFESTEAALAAELE